MGGVIILFGLLLSVFFWGDLSNTSVLFCVYIAISFGLLGAFDDYKKIKLKIFSFYVFIKDKTIKVNSIIISVSIIKIIFHHHLI